MASTVSVTGTLASGRHSMTLRALARQKVPPWVTSTCQIVGPRGTMPALRTAPTRARRPSAAATVRVPARAALPGLNVPGPRKVRVPAEVSTTKVSPALRLSRALSGSERPAG